jgi:arsenate reductase
MRRAADCSGVGAGFKLIRMSVTIWHNPKCGASRNALAYLREHGIEPEIFLYVQENPSRSKIEKTLKRAGLKPSQALRAKEAIGEELGLYEAPSEKAILDAMAEHPILIQRPIVVTPKGAVIARPSDKLNELIAPLL